jgi:hypothetical protein
MKCVLEWSCLRIAKCTLKTPRAGARLAPGLNHGNKTEKVGRRRTRACGSCAGGLDTVRRSALAHSGAALALPCFGRCSRGLAQYLRSATWHSSGPTREFRERARAGSCPQASTQAPASSHGHCREAWQGVNPGDFFGQRTLAVRAVSSEAPPASVYLPSEFCGVLIARRRPGAAFWLLAVTWPRADAPAGRP